MPEDARREQLVHDGNIKRPAVYRRRLQLIRKCGFLTEFCQQTDVIETRPRLLRLDRWSPAFLDERFRAEPVKTAIEFLQQDTERKTRVATG